MRNLEFMLDNSAKPYSDFLVEGANHASSAFCLEKPVFTDSRGIKLYVVDVLPEFNAFLCNSNLALGLNTIDDEVYLRKLLFKPENAINGFEGLFKDYDIQKSCNSVLIHELMELLCRKAGVSNHPHDLLMHYGGDLACVNNIKPVYKNGLSDEQRILLGQVGRSDDLCYYHKNAVMNYLSHL